MKVSFPSTGVGAFAFTITLSKTLPMLRAKPVPGILEQLTRLQPAVFGEFQHRSGALLLHCSGGMDRSAPVAAFIAAREETCSGQDDHGS